MIAKKGSGLTSVSYAEALEAALCHGWIDGQKQAHDSDAWLQKFTPRGARSIWSKINREKAEQLIASGRMMPAGLRAIENAKRNGRWENSPAIATQPQNASPDDVAKLADHVHDTRPDMFNKAMEFYREHPQLVKVLGTAAIVQIAQHLSRQHMRQSTTKAQ